MATTLEHFLIPESEQLTEQLPNIASEMEAIAAWTGRDATEMARLEEALAANKRRLQSLAENLPNYVARYDREPKDIYSNEELGRLLVDQILHLDQRLRKKAVELNSTRTHLLNVLRTIPDMVWMKDIGGAYRSCNPAFEKTLGKPAQEILGKTDHELFDAAQANHFRAMDQAALEAKQVCIYEQWVVHPEHGKRMLLETRKVPVRDTSGNVIGVLGVARDNSQRRHFEDVLASREREFRTLVEHSSDTIARYGKDYRRLYINPTFARLNEGRTALLIGRKPSDFPGGPNAILYEQQLGEVFASGKEREFELQWRLKDGEELCHLVRLTPEPGPDGTVESVLAVGRDISELYAYRKKINRMAFYDPLTALPNRTLFNDRLREAIAAVGTAARRAIGVMMIDIDRFKGVNDTMGHAMGDELLREAAERLRACVRPGDTVARLGGDEFAIVLPDIGERHILEGISRSIIAKFDERFVLDGKEVFVSCSIGIAQYPFDSSEAHDLVKYADSAMYLAKRSGRRSFRFYSRKLTVDAEARLELESELRHAIERGELELHYQPKVTFEDKEVIGSEGLLRWHRSGVGLVAPGDFIPVAEETGLITDLGEWVLREACRTAVEMNADGTRLHRIAVNLSARQFQAPELVATIRQIMIETGCCPEWLELEITESLLMEENDAILGMLSELRSIGFSIAIDDFGTGYSALSYLTRFPIDTLKIDRSFVQKVTTNQSHAELVKAILSIARCLGQQVVAEGVETVEQAEFLQAHGCKVAQGFLFSKPLAKSDMILLPRYFRQDRTTEQVTGIAGGHRNGDIG
ncbi:EAL domain-containing protein [Cupriavidus necator]|uniref:EAL domain-containing protein n=1 Tax=Cupriavidus necator TaxID=106590 RepID=A0A367PHB4_CUPNE|nr:GGDEF and EAL domain-containing protein [Cupriavidus necator]QQX86663.1 EAL domain-containing protein [Cupriavidus necator]RCJ07259.1 EAL domain-containing protein [Cupriavidus necator]